MTSQGTKPPEIPESAYLAALTPEIISIIDCALHSGSPDGQLEQFASFFLTTLEDQGALIPDSSSLGENPLKLLGLALSHHLRTPDNPIAWFNVAVALRIVALSSPQDDKRTNQHRLALAVNACTKAIQCDDRAIRSWTELGINLHLLGETTKALTSFEQALQLKPNDVSLWLWKAFALERLGNRPEALESVRRARAYYSKTPERAMQHLFDAPADADALVVLMNTLEKSLRDRPTGARMKRVSVH
jgi:tetratricopeptide (TPR) repeat protein